MMPRSQIAALAVLLVGLVVVLALVANAGVSTGVFSTATPTATFTPSPTPPPVASADNWTSAGPGQLTYSADPSITAQIRYQTFASVDDSVSSIGLTAPAADDPYPLISLLKQLQEALSAQVDSAQLSLAPDAFIGPSIEIVENTPVAMLRLQIAPQTTGSGQSFAGVDLVQMFIQHPDNQVTFVQYGLQGEPSQAVYAGFQAWLSANISDLLAQQAPTPTPTMTPGPTEQATPEATQGATATPGAVTPEPTEEVAVTPEPVATAVPTVEPTAESSGN
jgi:hypothetical protein